MAGRYPEIEPYASGMLAVGEGNLVYWETCGNPDGATPTRRSDTASPGW